MFDWQLLNWQALGWIDRIVCAFALWFGGGVLLALLTLTVIDVTGRYALNAPFYGSLDLYGVLLALVVAVCIPYGQRSGAHVSADIFATMVGTTVDRVVAIMVRALSAAVAALWACYLYFAGNTSAMLEESTQLLGIPFQPVYYVLAFGIGLYALILLVEAAVLVTVGTVPQLADRGDAAPRTADE